MKKGLMKGIVVRCRAIDSPVEISWQDAGIT
jgi:hypothetical protein